MVSMTAEAGSISLGVFIHLLCAVAFALAPWCAACYDTDKQDVYNILAPPDYVFSTFVSLLGSIVSGNFVLKYRHFSWIFDTVDRIDDATESACILSLSLLTFVALFIHLLLGFMLFGSLRLYLAPIALTLMWYKSIPCYGELDGESRPTPQNAIEAIKLAMDKISVRVWFTWLTAAMIFLFIDIVQFLEGQYFNFAVYANLMGVLIAVAVALYVASRDPVVAWVAMWFVVGLAMRKAELKGDAKETLETLQTVALAIVPIFAIVLLVDTTQGFYDFFVRFVARSDTSSDADGRLNAGYGAV